MTHRGVSTSLRGIKTALKKSSVISTLNAKVKARLLKHEWRSLHDMYAKRILSQNFCYSTDWVRSTVAVRLDSRGIIADTPTAKRPSVFWIGANWDQDNSGFLSNLSKLTDLTWATKRDGEYGHAISSDGSGTRQPDRGCIGENDACLVEQISRLHAERPIDLVWGQMWANYVSPETLTKVQGMGIRVVNISMDDRLPEHWASFKGYRLGSIGLGKGVDLVLTTSSECCEWYGAEDVPALFWPLASDPETFYPAPDEEKIYDIAFVGNRYGIRARIVDELTRAGLHVTAFGGGWPRGYVNAAQVSEVFRRSRIVLGIGTIGHNEDLFTLKLRDFDAPMSGALYITHRNPDLLQLYREGEEVECYSTVQECIDKMQYYLNNREKRHQLAAAGRERARCEHSWSLRIIQALGEVGIHVPGDR